MPNLSLSDLFVKASPCIYIRQACIEARPQICPTHTHDGLRHPQRWNRRGVREGVWREAMNFLTQRHLDSFLGVNKTFTPFVFFINMVANGLSPEINLTWCFTTPDMNSNWLLQQLPLTFYLRMLLVDISKFLQIADGAFYSSLAYSKIILKPRILCFTI